MRIHISRLGLGALLLWGLLPGQALAQTQNDFFDANVLQEVRLTMRPDDWQKLKQHYLDNTYYECIFKWRNLVVEGVGIRSRGTGSRSPVKPGLRVDFDRFAPTQDFLGLKSFILRNQTQDASQMHERLGMQLFTRMGVPAVREAHTRFYVNDEYIGLYTFVESVDKVYLKRNYGEDGGYLYKYDFNAGDEGYRFEYRGSDPRLYSPLPFKPETREDTPNPAPLEAMIRAMNNNSGASFQSAMAEFLDLKATMTYLATESYLADQDGILGDFGMNNFYFYRYASKNLSVFIPWDKSNAFWDINRSIMTNTERVILMKKALEIPELKTFYLKEVLRAASLAGGEGGWLAQEIEKEYTQIRQAAYDDPNKQCLNEGGLQKPCSNAEFEAAVDFLRRFAKERPAVVTANAAANGLAVAQLIASTSPSGLRFGALAGNTPAPQNVSLSSSVSGSNLSFTVATSGGSWLNASPASGTTPATLTVTVTPGSLAAGDYTATINITAGSATNSPVTIPVNLGILAPGTQPVLGTGGAVNAASSSTTLAPGSLISVYGQRLASGQAGASSLPLPTELAGASIRINNLLAPVLFASEGQVNVQVPWETVAGNATVTALFKGVEGNTITSTIAPYSPGVFVTVYPNGGLVDSSKPAASGDILVVYANGLGPVTPSVVTGQGAPSNPVANTTTLPTVTIGGVNAEVLFAGLSPGFVGLFQVNVRVPAGVASGSATPLVIKIGEAAAPPKTIATR